MAHRRQIAEIHMIERLRDRGHDGRRLRLVEGDGGRERDGDEKQDDDRDDKDSHGLPSVCSFGGTRGNAPRKRYAIVDDLPDTLLEITG